MRVDVDAADLAGASDRGFRGVCCTGINDCGHTGRHRPGDRDIDRSAANGTPGNPAFCNVGTGHAALSYIGAGNAARSDFASRSPSGVPSTHKRRQVL